MRTLSEATREAVLDGMRIVESIAATHGAEAAVQFRRGYPVTVKDAGFAGFVLETARGLVGADRTHLGSHPTMGGEDFSYVLQRVPGAMANFGTPR